MNKYSTNFNGAVAHIKRQEDGTRIPHSLEDHLRKVACLASEKAKPFSGQAFAALAGQWHDLGKYRPAFQSYIDKDKVSDDENAHIEQGGGRVDHSTAGAIHAVNKLGIAGRVIAYLIAGHHAGLPDWSAADGGNAALECRLENGKKVGYLDEALAETIPEDILHPGQFIVSKIPGEEEGVHVWVRLLFSCLVDADFLDTEIFMDPDKAANRAVLSSLHDLKEKFDNYMQVKIAHAKQTPVNNIRTEVLQHCRDAAAHPPGVFTLTVPTGGGKTLSSMAFAFDHALKHNKRRVIFAIPYTSIIEQTAEQYREILGDVVIEHHSNLDPDQESAKSRLASENWDAPIIVTTNIQLLESLFSARPSRCRKLHNLVNSVVIIDEAQLLAPNFLQPILDVLRILTTHYGVTLVLSTATQPVLNTLQDAFGKTTLRGIDNGREIIPNVSDLYSRLSRVNVEKPIDLTKGMSWENLAEELCQYDSVLVIVNTRKDCRDLFDLMPQGTIHLSARMCGEHRSHVIKEIKRKLKEKEPVRVISTQLVEAGVDLDFPVVYRALAGLDSIAQAAGRCNREGELEKGRLVVFVPPAPAPQGILLAAEEATINVWHEWEGDALDEGLYPRYFKDYFSKARKEKKEEENIVRWLTAGARRMCIGFRKAAENFNLIKKEETYQILVPYDEKGEKLLDILAAKGPERYLMRKLQRYSVNIYEDEFQKLQTRRAIEEIKLGMGIYSLSASSLYNDKIGLQNIEDVLCNSGVI